MEVMHMRFGRIEHEVDLALKDDMRVEYDSKDRMVSRMKKSLVERGIRVPGWMNNDEVIAYWKKWQD